MGLPARVTTLLNVQLRGQRCRVHSTELRVRVKATGLGTYPDVPVVCGRLERDPDDRTGCAVVVMLVPDQQETPGWTNRTYRRCGTSM